MSFKDNLLKKIQIDDMSRTVINSIGPPASGSKVDKETLRRLLEISTFKVRMERDLELYISKGDDVRSRILVLDNELALYHTTAQDVAMRKSPTVKEMLNIRNVIKILKDTDVVISKREDSVRTIQQECLATLDLSFDKSDLLEIEKDGAASLENSYADGVVECLSLFAEMLDFKPPPNDFKIDHHKIIGNISQEDSGETMYGPIVMYSLIHNSIKLIDESIRKFDKEKIEWVQQVAAGNEDASAEGPAVLQYLREKVETKSLSNR